MPVPLKSNIVHYRGDSLALLVRLWVDPAKTEPADLSLATVRAQVRETANDNEVAASFEVNVVGNEVNAVLSPKSSRDLPPTAFYDIEVDWFSDDTSVQTIVAGGLNAAPDVTREA
jgi:hypothetical protein